MASRDLFFSFSFEGGFASDLGALVNPPIAPSGGGGAIGLPHLLTADNIYYRLDGAPVKTGGTSKYNSSAIASGQEIAGMFEYVRAGTGGSATRKRVVHAGTVIVNDDNDASFSNLFTGLEDGAIPHYNVFEDVLIIASDSNSDVPMSWDQTTAQNLAGSPPNFAFSATHSGRVWAAGVAANPSRLYYSATGDHEDWAGGGSIDISPNDGDIITGIVPYRGDLIVFKGPYRGSITRVVGDPADSDFNTSPRTTIRGIGAVWQNSLFEFGNDIGFIHTDGSVRSFQTTDKFGDYEQLAFSDSISGWIRDNVTISALRTAWAETDHLRGYTLIALPISGSTTPNHILMMDFRFRPVRWSHWPAFDAFSIARMSDPDDSNLPILYLGGSDGFLRKSNQNAFSIDGSTAISEIVKTPAISYNTPHKSKTHSKIGLGVRAAGTVSATITTTNEDGDQNSVTISGIQGGTALGSFVLDTDTLGAEIHKTYWADAVSLGSFREISYEFQNTGLDQGLEITEFYTVLEGSGTDNFEN